MEDPIHRIFAGNGILRDEIPGYEFRKEQHQMADFISERLYESENGLIEAGTGTGKTLAYLVPSIIYAIENEKKVTVTTETKALQKQLIEKDLPLVKKILKKNFSLDFTSSLCLGSGNYPCRRRFESAVKKGQFAQKDLSGVEILNEFFGKKKIFTRFDLPVSASLWTRVAREPDACISFKCVFAKMCPYQLAKKEWAASHVLIMNHYLYFTNISMGRTYLPVTDITLFDEAHSVEDIASAQLGFSLGYSQFLEITERFYHGRKRNRLVQNISNPVLKKKIIDTIKELQAGTSRFFEEVRSFFPGNAVQLRLKEKREYSANPAGLLRELLALMGEAEDEFDDDFLRMEYDIAMGRLFQFSENLAGFISMNDENSVYWIERSDRELIGDVFLKGQPVSVAKIMEEDVLPHNSSSLFVSATLSAGGDFRYITERLGLRREKSLVLESSFNFREQAVIYLESGPGNPNDPGFIEKSAETASKIIKHLGGNCLLLLTSYRSLEIMKEKIRELTDYPVFSQDEYTSSRAVEMYRDHDNSILMGTHSFWQGIDLPGDLLRGVIMMRLPFSVPDSPVVEAKMERLAEQGKNPFLSFQVPDAIIRFRQGFGRLIRSRSDRGIVAVMDPRIVTKPYGRHFLSSVPGCDIVYTVNELVERFSPDYNSKV